jgi:hypothetical protein
VADVPSRLSLTPPKETKKKLDIVVGIATGYRPHDQGVGVRAPVGVRIFTSPGHPDEFWGPPNLLSTGVKRSEREADYSSPASAEVKEMWICPSTPPLRLHGIVLN